jgi:hypothetical protein
VQVGLLMATTIKSARGVTVNVYVGVFVGVNVGVNVGVGEKVGVGVSVGIKVAVHATFGEFAGNAVFGGMDCVGGIEVGACVIIVGVDLMINGRTMGTIAIEAVQIAAMAPMMAIMI